MAYFLGHPVHVLLYPSGMVVHQPSGDDVLLIAGLRLSDVLTRQAGPYKRLFKERHSAISIPRSTEQHLELKGVLL